MTRATDRRRRNEFTVSMRHSDALRSCIPTLHNAHHMDTYPHQHYQH